MTKTRKTAEIDIDNDVHRLKTMLQTVLADELEIIEERMMTKFAALLREHGRPCRCQLQEAGSGATQAQPPPAVYTRGNQAPAENKGASGNTGASELLVLGDSITFALSTNGLSKLCQDKSVAIQSTSGAVPATLVTPTVAAVKDIVVHVGTNCINSTADNTEHNTPSDIAADIVKHAKRIGDANKLATIHISAILERADLTDDAGDLMAANDKIKETNALVKEHCLANGYKHIDNSNIKADDLYDGLHLNQAGALKLAKNISAAVRHKPVQNLTTETGAKTTFRKLKPPTIGEKANVRRQQNTRDRPAWAHQPPRTYHPSGAQLPSGDRQPLRDARPPWDRQRRQRGEFNAAWPALPNRSGSAANGQGRYGDQQADFMNTLINTLLNNNHPQYY